jgi:hypothetical protein
MRELVVNQKAAGFTCRFPNFEGQNADQAGPERPWLIVLLIALLKCEHLTGLADLRIQLFIN